MSQEDAPEKVKIQVALCFPERFQDVFDVLSSAFQESPLAASYELELLDLPTAPDAKREAKIVVGHPETVTTTVDTIENLQWLMTVTAGVNRFVNQVKRRDFLLTRLGGVMGQQMSEFVIGAIMSEDWHQIQISSSERQWHSSKFDRRPRLSSMTLGTLGVGDIATEVAKAAKAFNMRTLGLASRERPVDGFDVVTTSLERVLKEADVIASILPDTPQTQGLLDGGALKACGKGKLLINVGRGTVVSESSIVEALDEGWLRRAILDVFTQEPLPASSPLWGHSGVVITPHIAAVTYPEDVATGFLENLERWLRGEPLCYQVDLDKGY